LGIEPEATGKDGSTVEGRSHKALLGADSATLIGCAVGKEILRRAWKIDGQQGVV
jgi:hypothetical protein